MRALIRKGGIAKLPGHDRHRESEAFLDQREMESRRQADAEDVSEDRQCGGIGMPRLDRLPGERDPRDLRRPTNDEAPLPFLRRLHGVDGRDRTRRRRNRAEVTCDRRQSLALLEVADQDRRGVVRMVEDIVELLQAVGRDALDVRAPSDRRMVVRMLPERRGERVLVEHLEGGVLAALVLVAHDGHFRDPVGIAQERAAHP